jgi:hypothetical protein
MQHKGNTRAAERRYLKPLNLWTTESMQCNSIQVQQTREFQKLVCDSSSKCSLHARGPHPVTLSGNMAAGDILQRCAATQGHGEHELVPQHPQHTPHAHLAIHGKGEQQGPANLKKWHCSGYIATLFSQSDADVEDLQILLMLPTPRPWTRPCHGGCRCQGIQGHVPLLLWQPRCSLATETLVWKKDMWNLPVVGYDTSSRQLTVAALQGQSSRCGLTQWYQQRHIR